MRKFKIHIPFTNDQVCLVNRRNQDIAIMGLNFHQRFQTASSSLFSFLCLNLTSRLSSANKLNFHQEDVLRLKINEDVFGERNKFISDIEGSKHDLTPVSEFYFFSRPSMIFQFIKFIHMCAQQTKGDFILLMFVK